MQATLERLHQAGTWMKEHFGSELRPVTVASEYWSLDQYNNPDLFPSLLPILQQTALDTGCEVVDKYIPIGDLYDPRSFNHVIEIHRGKNKDSSSFLNGLTGMSMKVFDLLEEKGISADNPGILNDPLDQLLASTYKALFKDCLKRSQPLSN